MIRLMIGLQCALLYVDVTEINVSSCDGTKYKEARDLEKDEDLVDVLAFVLNQRLKDLLNVTYLCLLKGHLDRVTRAPPYHFWAQYNDI